MSKIGLVLLTATTTATRCSKVTRNALWALSISFVTLALATAALPLTGRNTAAVTNTALVSFSSSNLRFTSFALPCPLPKHGRAGQFFFSPSNAHSYSSPSVPSVKFCRSRNVDFTTDNIANNYSDNSLKQKQRQRKKKAVVSPETYTNHWDNLLLEEHRLALDEWRDRRNKCSLQTLENRGLAISRAFALPDSEVLGEKTVRIHNGSGGKHVNMNMNGDVDSGRSSRDDSDRLVDGGSRGKDKSNGGRGRFCRGWNELFSKGDILEMTANGSGSHDSMIGRGGFSSQAFRRECLVMDVGDSWMLVGVGKTWPLGLWDARKGFRGSSNGKRSRMGGEPSYGYPVRLDKTPNAAALIPLRAQRSALQAVREQQQEQHIGPMMIATWLTKTTKEHCKGYYQLRNKKRWAQRTPHHFREMISKKNSCPKKGSEQERSLVSLLQEAIERVSDRRSTLSSSKMKNWGTNANASQREAVVWALSRRVSSIQGPPGTGKTRVAALLIATALEMAQNNCARSSATFDKNGSSADQHRPFRILAVAHSNGAADVLLKALLELGVPAVRAGRPAAISDSVRHRSAAALAEKIPQVVRLRKELLAASDNNRDTNSRTNIEKEMQQCIEDAQDALLNSAPVVVSTCIGAHQLSQQERNQQGSGMINAMDDNDVTFPLVVLDEAAQCTEPALLCALVAARAEQLVMVGDTKQLPPTVASSSKELRESLGISPMERLEKYGLVEQKTLQIQYRLVQALLDHPSKYFYNGLVKSATESAAKRMPLVDQKLITGAFSEVEEDSIEAPPAGFAWPNPLLPLAFISVGGGEAEVVHASSLGLAGRSNPREAKLVAEIVADILEEGELRSSQIYILTPYSKQVSAIRLALEKESLRRLHRSNNNNRRKKVERGDSKNALSTQITMTDLVKSMNDVCVGTVDSFQGQENEAVIFSAVRSNSFSELGFLRDPRRLCVALTRARKALIILGDPTVLNSCRHWRSLIESCKHRNCFINENHLSLPTSSKCEPCKNSTLTGEVTPSDNGNENSNNGWETLYGMKPSEEFFGLF